MLGLELCDTRYISRAGVEGIGIYGEGLNVLFSDAGHKAANFEICGHIISILKLIKSNQPGPRKDPFLDFTSFGSSLISILDYYIY